MARASSVFAATVLLAAALPVVMAADPMIGSWKWTASDPNIPSPVIEVTEVYRELTPGQIELTWKDKRKDGSSRLYVFNFPAEGGSFKCLQGCTEGDTGVILMIRPGEWVVANLRDGKQILPIRYKAVSKDGNVHIETSRRQGEQGKVVEVQREFHRQ